MLGRFYTPEALAHQMTELGHRFIIGYEGKEPVAFASYSEIMPGIYKLHKLYVIMAMKGKGAGRAMVDHIVADIKRVNANQLRLNVNIYNKGAMAFYERYGFRHLLDEDIDIGEGYFMNDHVLGLDMGSE